MKNKIAFINGTVLTVDSENSIAEALIVENEKIAGVGKYGDLKGSVDANTEVIDLDGRSIVPGFIDSHIHMGVLGMNSEAIDCRYPYVKSIEDIKEKIAEQAKIKPKGSWIRGWGYDHSKLIESRHPDRFDMDEVAPYHPVMLTRTCAHISTLNTLGLEKAGIDNYAPDIPGGIIEKTDSGIPTGVMKENAHMAMMKAAMPNKAELKTALEKADKILISEGITSVHDSGGYGEMQLEVEKEAIKEGLLQIKVNAMIFSFIENISFVENHIKLPVDNGNDPHFKIGPIKIMIDGSSSGPTAATIEPYAIDPGFSGVLSMDPRVIDDIILRAHKAGHQVTSHAVGDRAVDVISRAIEKALIKYPRDNHRHRIEHCAIVNDELLQRIKKNNIIPVPQPIFLYEFGDGYVKNYGKERTDRMFTCKSFIDMGILAPGSSDCPITFSNPLMGIHLAVNRITQSGQPISQNEKISKEEALRMFTYNGAYTSFEESIKGSIEVGKAADLAVLSGDFPSCEDSEIMNLKVDMTFIDGKCVYRRNR